MNEFPLYIHDTGLFLLLLQSIYYSRSMRFIYPSSPRWHGDWVLSETAAPLIRSSYLRRIIHGNTFFHHSSPIPTTCQTQSKSLKKRREAEDLGACTHIKTHIPIKVRNTQAGTRKHRTSRRHSFHKFPRLRRSHTISRQVQLSEQEIVTEFLRLCLIWNSVTHIVSTLYV